MSTAASPANAGRLRPQDRRALIGGFLALFTMLGYARIVRPAIEELARQREALVQQQGLLARERSLLAVAPALPRAKVALKQVLAGEKSRLFAGDSVAATAELSSFVADVASAAGVRLSALDGRAPNSTRGVTRLSADVRGEGSWRQVLAFIRALESSARLVDLTSVRLERGARGGSLGGALVSVSATIAGFSRGAP